MTPEELAKALEALGVSHDVAWRRIPEIQEGDNAQDWDYHLVHRRDGRVSVELADDRSNKTSVTYWRNQPAVFDTADEARAAIFELSKRAKEIYG